jgi:hypothetical protein
LAKSLTGQGLKEAEPAQCSLLIRLKSARPTLSRLMKIGLSELGL